MKTTIDVPEPLYRRVKALAALRGRAVRDVTIELYERWLSEAEPPARGDAEARTTAWLSRWEELGAAISRRAADPRPATEILLSDRR